MLPARRTACLWRRVRLNKESVRVQRHADRSMNEDHRYDCRRAWRGD